MKRFSTSGLMMIAGLGSIIAAELWQRRKLKRATRRATYEARLMHTAIRITHEVRGSLDIPRALNKAAAELAIGLNAEHCRIWVCDDDNQYAFACSCGETEHDLPLSAALDAADQNIGATTADRYVSDGTLDSVTSTSESMIVPVLGVPIVQSDGLIGAVLVLSTNPHRIWLESEVQLLLAVAHQLYLSVSHARVFAAKEQESLTDALTNCLNRRAFQQQLEEHFKTATERKLPMSLIIVDLDLFKSINDNYGHPFGDRVLRRPGEILLEETVNRGIAARVGGEEFALILPNHSIEESAAIAEQVRRRVQLVTLQGLDRQVTVSCGVASFPSNAQTGESLFAAADEALYRAKESGRNRVCLY